MNNGLLHNPEDLLLYRKALGHSSEFDTSTIYNTSQVILVFDDQRLGTLACRPDAGRRAAGSSSYYHHIVLTKHRQRSLGRGNGWAILVGGSHSVEEFVNAGI